MNLRRYTDNHTVKFLKYVVGLRQAETSVTGNEQRLLGDLARDKRCIVEVGVYEGATSRIFCQAMNPAGHLYLVDPFFPEVRLERLLKFSFTRWVATTTVKPWQLRTEFIRQPSVEAARALPLQGKAELIFIDARHDYDSVREDFHVWSPMLAAGSVIAFHDSHPCPARPDLSAETGPVRLMNELAGGAHGPWEIVQEVDSITVVRRRPSA